MIDLNLTGNQRQRFYDALIDSHRIRIDIKVLNRSEKEIGALTAPIHRVLSGAVQVDATAAVTRSLSIVVLDPNRKLRFEAKSPSQGALYADRFIAVQYQVWVESLARWVSIPVFWGPLTNYSRSGSEVTVEAMGKEVLMLDPHLVTEGYTIFAKTRLDDAIRKIARKATGETRFKIPSLGQKLSRSRVLHQGTEPWLALTNAKSTPGFISRSLVGGVVGAGGKIVKDISTRHPPGLIETVQGNFTAFYNGRGQLCVRKANRHSVYYFHKGRYLTSRPEVTYDTLAFRNCVIVKGGKPKGHENPAHGRAVLRPGNPMSPESLGRPGHPRFMVHFQDAENLKTNKACKEHAKKILDRMSKQGVEVSFQTLPVPMLEENDLITLETEEYSIDFQVRQFTIPLTSDEPMTIGRHERVKVRKRRRRHHGEHHDGHMGHMGHHRHMGHGHHGHHGRHFHPHAHGHHRHRHLGHGHHQHRHPHHPPQHHAPHHHRPGRHDPGRGGHPGHGPHPGHHHAKAPPPAHHHAPVHHPPHHAPAHHPPHHAPVHHAAPHHHPVSHPHHAPPHHHPAHHAVHHPHHPPRRHHH